VPRIRLLNSPTNDAKNTHNLLSCSDRKGVDQVRWVTPCRERWKWIGGERERGKLEEGMSWFHADDRSQKWLPGAHSQRLSPWTRVATLRR
jgi:hypothetical protein